MSERIVNVHEAEYNGKHFRSTLEMKTAQALDALGIEYAYEEKKITLLESFYSPFQKDKVRAITYTPDFMIGHIMLECKGFETPEWKIKKKLVFKWLQENEPQTIFYQIHDAKKSLMEVLDKHLNELGYQIVVTKKPTKKEEEFSKKYPSIKEALKDLNLKGRLLGSILASLTGSKVYVLGYNWKIEKINL